ncbi:hypothetical protein ACX0FC_17695, partial [Enterococcus faecium]
MIAPGQPVAATMVAVGPRDALQTGPELASVTTTGSLPVAALPPAGTPAVVAGIPVPQPSPLRPMVPVVAQQEPEPNNPL